MTPKTLKVFEEARSIEGYQNWTTKEQHDSCELLNRMIDHFEEKENFELSILLAGGTRSIRTCGLCKEFSQKCVDHHILSLPIRNFGTTIEDVIQSFCTESILDDDNKFKCTKCKKLTKTTKQMLIFKALKILVLKMKRFKGEDDRRKLKTHVEFDKELVISEHRIDEELIQVCYKLRAVLIHKDVSIEEGHFYAVTKHKDEKSWVR